MPCSPANKCATQKLDNHDDNPVLASVFELSSNRKCVRWDTTQVQTAAPSAGPSTIPGVEAPEYLPEDSQIPYEETPVHDRGPPTPFSPSARQEIFELSKSSYSKLRPSIHPT